jgi:hypothetical protein
MQGHNLHRKRGPAGASCLPVLKALSPEIRSATRSRTSERPSPRGAGREHSAVASSLPSQGSSNGPAGGEEARRLLRVPFVENQPATFREGTTVEHRRAQREPTAGSPAHHNITKSTSGHHQTHTHPNSKISPGRQPVARGDTWGGVGGAGLAQAQGRAGGAAGRDGAGGGTEGAAAHPGGWVGKGVRFSMVPQGGGEGRDSAPLEVARLILNPTPYTLNSKSETPNPKPQTLNPEP